MSRFLTPRDVRILLSRDAAAIPRWPVRPSGKTPSKQQRTKRLLRITHMYLVDKVKMEDIAKLEGVSHQRVTQLLQDGVNYLVSNGLIVGNST